MSADTANECLVNPAVSTSSSGRTGPGNLPAHGTVHFGSRMATNIYVGNLPWSTTTDELYAMFQQYGAVTRAQVVTDRETGRSRGFGFVEMPNEAEANAAIAALNEQPMNGRPLTVNVAKPREVAVLRGAAAVAGVRRPPG